MPDSSAPEPTFVCDSEIWMRDACDGDPSYQTTEGKRYCVLHFPSKEKSRDFERALNKKLDDKDFNFSGVWFPDPLSFFKFDFDGNVIFNSATFNGAADFRYATFKTQAVFNSATFSAVANFDNATFRGSALFSSATFDAEALFNSATFDAAAYFRSTTFSAPTDFRCATFSGAAYFNATFDAAADFSESTFNGEAYFSSATFSSAANFRKTKLNAKAYFGNVTFGEIANFRKAIFGKEANFGDATFSAAVDFREVSFEAKADFIHSTFSGAADFTSATFSAATDFRSSTFSGDVEFISCTLSGETDFSDATFRDYVKFAGDESKLVFSSTSSLSLEFARIEKPDHLSFHTLSLRPHWFVNIDASKFDLTNVKWRPRGINVEIKALEGKKASSIHRLLAIACRQLAVNAEDNHRYEEASMFRYMAMDVRRRERWRGLAFWRLGWWYWLASGYGERIWRALVTLLLIWLVFAAAYMITGHIKPLELPGYNDYIKEFVAALNYSLQVLTFQKPDKPAGFLTPLLVTFETILGPVQAALLALAIRRKFMR